MALAFICGVALLFVGVLLVEGGFGSEEPALRPAGLLRWLVTGNWTAKFGALLLTIGTGALLRYLMLNVQLPPADKLMAGVVITAILGVSSGVLAVHSRRRAISLALAGAALAVAYLTAYSAYGYFNYVASVQALGMLFLVASAATVVAIVRRALSIAVLGMVGAYIAPAFALHIGDPISVYGYYVAASTLTLIMIGLRGWRPLIHLSFLFTLAGAVFFAWTRNFYTPDHYAQMQPLLLILVAQHLAMPLVEGIWPSAPAVRNSWVRHFDEAYFLLLPLTASVLTVLIVPSIAREGALGLSGLAVLWLVAAGIQHVRFGQGALRYLAVAALLLMTAGLIAANDVPVLLIAALMMCALIIVSGRLELTEGSVVLVAVVALVAAACYTLRALFGSFVGAPLLNVSALENLVLGAALLAAGRELQRRRQFLAAIFFCYGATWSVAALLRELLRLQFVHIGSIGYLAALAGILIYIAVAKWRSQGPGPYSLGIFGVGLFATGLASAADFPASFLIPLMLGGQILFSLLALQADRAKEEPESAGAIARSALPVLMVPWAIAFNRHLATPSDDVIWTFLVSSALWASLQAQWLLPRARVWPNWLSPVGFLLVGVLLFYETLIHIERAPWAVAFELIALVYLAETARFLVSSENRDGTIFGYVAVAAAAAVSAAMLLRFIGPPGTLTILALNHMLWPAFVSLLWVAIGATLTWLSTRNRSRTLWSLGAALLVAAAAKLILLDFGSLGQIGNIVAMMAAGGVFLLVAWLAPFPPRPAHEPAHEPTPHTPHPGPAPAAGATRSAASAAPAVPGRVSTSASPRASAPNQDDAGTSRGWIWILVIVIAILAYGRWVQHDRARESPAVLVVPARARVLSVQAPVSMRNTAGIAAGGDVPRTQESGGEDVCRQFAAQIPEDYLVYAVGTVRHFGRRSAQMNPQLPTTSESPTIHVHINDGEKNVILALSTAAPTSWNIELPGAGRVVGVILSGNRHSEVTGLSRSVPVLHAAAEDHAQCGFFRVEPGMPQDADLFINRLVAHSLDGTFIASGDRVSLGGEAAVADIPVRSVPQVRSMQAVPPTAPASAYVLSALYMSSRNGHSLNVTGEVRSQCDGQVNCQVSCGNQLAGDPDFGTPKQCEIEYKCDMRSTHVLHVREGGRVMLSCP
jgi:uncharacterized membrane protein